MQEAAKRSPASPASLHAGISQPVTDKWKPPAAVLLRVSPLSPCVSLPDIYARELLFAAHGRSLLSLGDQASTRPSREAGGQHIHLCYAPFSTFLSSLGWVLLALQTSRCTYVLVCVRARVGVCGFLSRCCSLTLFARGHGRGIADA